MTNRFCKTVAGVVGLGICSMSLPALAEPASCVGLPSFGALKSALTSAVAEKNGGLGFNMWATVVANDGTVCAVTFSGDVYTDQWLASRLISAQKAETANGLSLSKGAPPQIEPVPRRLGAVDRQPLLLRPNRAAVCTACSTAIRWTRRSPTRDRRRRSAPPPIPSSASGSAASMSSAAASGSTLRAAPRSASVGVSGDTSCTDHFVAWRVRAKLKLDHLGDLGTGGVTGDPKHPDNIIFDITPNPLGGTASARAGSATRPASTTSQTPNSAAGAKPVSQFG